MMKSILIIVVTISVLTKYVYAIGFGGDCSGVPASCDSLFTCVANKCKCSDLNTYWDGTNCDSTKLEVNIDCPVGVPSGVNPCKGDMTCVTVGSLNKCQCDSSKYWSGVACITRNDLKEDCGRVQEDSCIIGLSCLAGTNKCGCSESTKYWTGSDCVARFRWNDACAGRQFPEMPCSSEFTCSTAERCVCTGTNRYYTGSACQARIDNLQQCTAPGNGENPCLSNLQCTSGTCRCAAQQFWVAASQTCAPASGYGATCNGNDECSSTKGLTCRTVGADKLCRCPTTHFWYSTSSLCTTLDNVRINPLTLEANTPNSLVILWHAPTQSQFITRYDVTYSPGTTLTNQRSPTTISSLTAGTTYSVKVISVVIELDETKYEESPSHDFTTQPDQPGVITSPSLDGFAATDFLLIWTASSGNVHYYNVKVMDGNTAAFNGNTITGEHQISVTGLKHGHRYQIQIRAFVALLIRSIPRTNDIRTVVTQPSAPGSVTLTTFSSTSVRVIWTVPSDINGDLRGYVIEVYTKLYREEQLTVSNTLIMSAVTETTLSNIGLTAGTFTKVRMYATNDVYNGTLYTESSEVRTTPGTPGAVDGFSATSITSASMTISWNRPLEPGGDIEGYSVHLSSTSSDYYKDECAVYKSVCSTTCSYDFDGLITRCIGDSPPIGQYPDYASTDTSLSFTISTLKPYTAYRITIYAYTSAGKGSSNVWSITTLIASPEKVTVLNVETKTETSVTMVWQVPQIRPGPTTYILNAVDKYTGNAMIPCSANGYTSTSCRVSDLDAFWEYRISVTTTITVNNPGSAAVTDEQVIRTEEGDPGGVQSLKNEMPGSFIERKITWMEPRLRNRNGNITQYQLNYTGHKIHDTTVKTSGTATESATYNPNMASKSFSKTITVIPQYSYLVEVFAITAGGKYGAIKTTDFETKPGPPPAESPGIESVSQCLEGVKSDTQTSIKLTMKTYFFKNNENGIITDYGLVISAASKQQEYIKIESITEFDAMNNWDAARSKGFPPYRVSIEQNTNGPEFTFIMGGDICSSSNNKWCNGQLNSGTEYVVKIIACTSGGCMSTRFYNGPFKTKQPDSSNEGFPLVAVVVPSVVSGVLTILLLIYLVLIFRRRYLHSIEERYSISNRAPEVLPDERVYSTVKQGHETTQHTSYCNDAFDKTLVH